jgi:hypothetical protein
VSEENDEYEDDWIPISVPALGELAMDTRRKKVGVVTQHVGPYVQLRAPGGGTEWYARLEEVRPADAREELRAKVAERNAYSGGIL